MLFQTIDEMKVHVGGGINTSVKIPYLRAAYQQARDKHLERYLGDAFLDQLEAWNLPAADPAPTSKADEAIQAVGRALALLTVYEYTFTSSVEMGGRGLVREEGDKVKGAYKYQVNEYRAAHHKAGLEALDNALRFCEANVDDPALSTWKNSDAQAYHREVLLREARQLRRVHNQPADRLAYEALRPLFYDLQEFVFVELLGQEQLDRLLSSIHSPSADAEVAAIEKKLVEMLQRALAAFGVHEGMRRNLVYLEGGRIVQREALEPQSTEKVSNAPINAINLSSLQNEEFAERYLDRIRSFLTANKAALPLYEAWLDSNQPDPDNDYPNQLGRPTGRKVVSL